MPNSLEDILFLWIPTGAGIALIALAGACIARSFRAVQLILGLPVILVSLWSIWVLRRMWLGAWPSFIPHIALGMVVPVVLVQIFLAFRSSRYLARR
jgi:hypothetical protein